MRPIRPDFEISLIDGCRTSAAGRVAIMPDAGGPLPPRAGATWSAEIAPGAAGQAHQPDGRAGAAAVSAAADEAAAPLGRRWPPRVPPRATSGDIAAPGRRRVKEPSGRDPAKPGARSLGMAREASRRQDGAGPVPAPPTAPGRTRVGVLDAHPRWRLSQDPRPAPGADRQLWVAGRLHRWARWRRWPDAARRERADLARGSPRAPVRGGRPRPGRRPRRR